MRPYAAKPGPECKRELIVDAGMERVRWTAWYLQFLWLVQWNQGCHQTRVGISTLYRKESIIQLDSDLDFESDFQSEFKLQIANKISKLIHMQRAMHSSCTVYSTLLPAGTQA